MALEPIKVFNRNISSSCSSEIKMKNNNEACSPNIKLASFPSNLIKGAYGLTCLNSSIDNKNRFFVPFSANPLYKINLRKVAPQGEKLIPANFSELIIHDFNDEWAMLNVQDIWSKMGDTPYADGIIDRFINPADNAKFYITEICDDTKELWNRITCLLKTTDPLQNDKSKLEIRLLQASPAIANNPDTAIKGSGELSLYGAVKLAKENGFKKLELLSTNNSFYEKMGLTAHPEIYNDPEGCYYELAADRFDDFLSRVEKKYNIVREKFMIRNEVT